MERFSNLMDDIKDALKLSSNNKGLFLPALIANLILFVASIAFVAFIIVTLVSLIGTFTASRGNDGAMNWMVLTSLIVGLLIIFSFFFIIFIALDIGISGLVISVLDGSKASVRTFFATIKKQLIPVFFTSIGLMFLYILGYIVLLIPLVIYLLTVGVFTGGWGMIFLACAFQSLLGYWILIKVEDCIGGFKSIRTNIRFGRDYFWVMVLLVFIQTNIAAFLPKLLGFMGVLIVAVFVSFVVTIIGKIVVLKTYRRYKEAMDNTVL